MIKSTVDPTAFAPRELYRNEVQIVKIILHGKWVSSGENNVDNVLRSIQPYKPMPIKDTGVDLCHI